MVFKGPKSTCYKFRDFTHLGPWLGFTRCSAVLKLTKISSSKTPPLKFPPFSHAQTEMAHTETLIVTKTDDESNRPPNPFNAIFSKFTQLLNFRFPPLPPAKKDPVKVVTEKKAIVHGDEVVEVKKSVTVTYPDARTKTVAPLKLESEEAEQETNPVVLWQVYAIGGFFILKWAWGRWNEHRSRKKPSSEDEPSPSPSPTAGED